VAKTVEIDEEQYLRDQQLRRALEKVVANPKAKLLLQEAHKMVDPQAITPELDREKSESERITAMRKEFDDFKAAVEKEKAEAAAARQAEALKLSVDTGLARLKREQHLTDEGIAAVRKLMEEKGILNADDAFAIFERQNPAPPPLTPRGNGAWNFLDIPEGQDGAAYAKKLLDSKGANDLVLDGEVNATLNNIRGAR
jgi:hypothetical protein